MRKIRKKVLIYIFSMFVFLFGFPINALAEENTIATEILASGEYSISEIRKIETDKDHITLCLSKINVDDGLNKNEISQLSKISSVKIENKTEDACEITDYILQSKKPLAVITKTDGGTEYYNEDVVLRTVKETGWVGEQKVVNNVVIQTTIKYFYYDVKGMGQIVKKLYQTESTLSGDTQNLRKIQMDTYATSLIRYDESGNEVKTGTESYAGHLYNVSGPGVYCEYTGTKYYYAAYHPNTSVYVTLKLTLSSGSNQSYRIKVI